MFMRAQISSQLATYSDNLTAFGLKKTMDFLHIKTVSIFSFSIGAYILATIVGQIIGGAINCIINYRWTFKAFEMKKKHIVFKFIAVWIGSLILNTIGTYFLTELLLHTAGTRQIFPHNDDIFIFTKLFIAVLVGFVWNYNMHRRFVYKNINIRKFFHPDNKHSENNYEREIDQ